MGIFNIGQKLQSWRERVKALTYAEQLTTLYPMLHEMAMIGTVEEEKEQDAGVSGGQHASANLYTTTDGRSHIHVNVYETFEKWFKGPKGASLMV